MSNFAEYNGKPIEGYLSDKEHFNGVLFLLREPNTDKQNEFWFKRSLEENRKQRSFSLYKNKFNIMLSYLPEKYLLKDCAYANIRPLNGGKVKSVDYINEKEISIFNRFNEIINCCDNRVKFVFTCYDIFNSILNNSNGVLTNENGIEYNKVKDRKRVLKYNGITIFEIYHPSYTKYPKKADNEYKQ